MRILRRWRARWDRRRQPTVIRVRCVICSIEEGRAMMITLWGEPLCLSCRCWARALMPWAGRYISEGIESRRLWRRQKEPHAG